MISINGGPTACANSRWNNQDTRCDYDLRRQNRDIIQRLKLYHEHHRNNVDYWGDIMVFRGEEEALQEPACDRLSDQVSEEMQKQGEDLLFNRGPIFLFDLIITPPTKCHFFFFSMTAFSTEMLESFIQTHIETGFTFFSHKLVLLVLYSAIGFTHPKMMSLGINRHFGVIPKVGNKSEKLDASRLEAQGDS